MIEPFDPTNAADPLLSRIYELLVGWRRSVAPDEPHDDHDTVVGALRHPPASEPSWHWLAHDALRLDPAGYASLRVRPGSSTGYVRLVVAPECRRRGLGTGLLVAVRAQAATCGCPTLTGIHGDDDATKAFAAAVGAVPGSRTVRSVLRLPPAVPPSPVDGFALRSWIGPTPDDLLSSFARVRDALNDAPRDDGVDRERWTPARLRDLERAAGEQGDQARVTAVLDTAAEVVAFNEMRVAPQLGTVARTTDTAVDPAHRRRGLAVWVKAESLRLLVHDRPDIKLVTTSNSAGNAAILAVNRRLGFRPVATWASAVLPL